MAASNTRFTQNSLGQSKTPIDSDHGIYRYCEGRFKNETSPPTISASGRRRWRAAGRVALRFRASLSVAAGACDRANRACRSALAVTAAMRSDALPDIPTVAEFVPGYEASNWYGVGAPKATPAEIVEKLHKEINAGLADPEIKARLADLGGTVLAGLPGDFENFVAGEIEKWAKVVKFAGIKPE